MYSERDKFRAEGLRALKALQAGGHGKVLTTDFVVAETLNFFVARSRDPGLPERVAQEILGGANAPWVKVLPVDQATWQSARERFRGLSKRGLSFTDCTSIAAVELLGLDGIVSFDEGFDGIVARFVE